MLVCVLRPPRLHRVVQLIVGLTVFGASDAMLVRAGLGLGPWDAFHQGLARHSSISIGTWVVIVGIIVLLAWIPLRMRPGLGTIANVALIGPVMNLTLDHLVAPDAWWARIALLVAGIALNGLATGMYIGAGLGTGPRDGLMTGIAQRGHSIRIVRTSIEIIVLACGFAMGGTIGVGTVAFALTIGPIAHVTIPYFAIERRRELSAA